MSPRRNQDGAVMFIVMLIIMASMATASMAVTLTTTELQGSGFQRQNMQAGYVAEASLITALDWVDVFGPETVRSLLDQGEGVTFTNNYPEIALAAGKTAYRLYPEHFAALISSDPSNPGPLTNLPVTQTASLGAKNAYTPLAVVDIYDGYDLTRALPGSAADGSAKLRYFRATMTSRGRVRVGGAGDVADPSGLRELNEGARDMRVYVTVGPYAAGQ